MVQQHELIVWAMSATIVLAATSDSLNSAYHPNESTQRFLREVTFASREDQCCPPAKRMKLTTKSQHFESPAAGSGRVHADSFGPSPELIGDTAECGTPPAQSNHTAAGRITAAQYDRTTAEYGTPPAQYDQPTAENGAPPVQSDQPTAGIKMSSNTIRPECAHCGKSCKTTSSRGQHQKTCSKNPAPEVIECAHCGKSYKTTSSRNAHQKSCVENQAAIRSHKCTLCGTSFTTTSRRNTHQKVCPKNPAAEVLECAHCGSRHATTGGRDAHQKTCLQNPAPEVEKGELEGEE